MNEVSKIEVSLIPNEQYVSNAEFDLDRIIYDLDGQIELLSSQADTIDYLVSVASGVLCGLLDVLWVGDFNLERGREIASDKVETFVKRAAKLTGCESDLLHIHRKEVMANGKTKMGILPWRYLLC